MNKKDSKRPDLKTKYVIEDDLMMKPLTFVFLVIVIVIFISTAQPASSQECVYDFSECKYYCEVHERLGCSRSNYFLSFGHRYCLQFLQRAREFSPQGRKILGQIRSCLIQNIQNDSALTCSNSWQRAKASHFECYTKMGFCNLHWKDRIKLFWLLRAVLSGLVRHSWRDNLSQKSVRISA